MIGFREKPCFVGYEKGDKESAATVLNMAVITSLYMLITCI
jgi:hypothetical protein